MFSYFFKDLIDTTCRFIKETGVGFSSTTDANILIKTFTKLNRFRCLDQCDRAQNCSYASIKLSNCFLYTAFASSILIASSGSEIFIRIKSSG